MAAPEGSSGLEAYVKGTKAWFADDEEGWMRGVLQSKTITGDNVQMLFKLEKRNKEVKFESTITKLAANKFNDLPPLDNPPLLQGIDDLANLSYLHEPAVLQNVRERYAQEQIYTYSGIVLIAMNPFQRMTSLYSPDIMREYSGKRRGELEPHLFAIAEEAYRKMLTENKNQSIIVSGESGAGKTQSAKYIMRYFATVDDLEKNTRNGSGAGAGGTVSEIEEAVLSTNPIMESFGNSKTTRNDNSSRFGKYIEILFQKADGGARICGAKMRTYLLERSRLIMQPATERNYHIFYQMCAAVPAAERKELGLGSWDSFHYLNQGGSGTIPGVDDAAEFAITQKALSTIGTSVSTQWDIFKLCAGLLHIGNIKVTAVRDEAQIADDDPALQTATRLLGVDRAEFRKWIVKKQIITRSEKIVTSVNLYQATVGKDSVAKFLYSMLFDWLVKLINLNLARDEALANSFIGVLDIYGFEHFKKNSFEQFCINYANEKLQQEFNRHVFKLEQDEYVAEKIEWSFIDFADNQPCIDLIEGKLGILSLLDEESRLPSGADKSLITKLYQNFAVPTQKFFEKPRFGQNAFTIKHYANDVTYDIDGFIEKNKDTVSDEQLEVLGKSDFAFLKEVITIEPEPVVETLSRAPTRSGPGAGGALKKPTLGSIFKSSLVKLMDTIRSTEAHYIRCIKPNQAKAAFQFEPQMVLSQLRACGVLETIRISCAGYPSRWSFQEFADRYYLLVKSKQWVADPKLLTQTVVKETISNTDKYQLGLSKVFFRAGQLAVLEKLRTERLRFCVVLIQKNMRKFIYQKRYKAVREAAVNTQTLVRAAIARKRYTEKRETIAAIRIQSQVRRHVAEKEFTRLRDAARLVQNAYRKDVSQKNLISLRQNRAAVKIQARWRCFSARRQYRQSVARVCLIQSAVRRKVAVKEYSSLKAESRSIGKLQEINYRLEGKVVELSQGIAAKELENKALLDRVAQLESQAASWKEKFTSESTKNKTTTVQVTEASAEMKKELQTLQETKETLLRDHERMVSLIKRKDDDIAAQEVEILKLKEENKKLKEDLLNAPKQEDVGVVNSLKKEVSSLRDQLSKVVTTKWQKTSQHEQQLNGYGFNQPASPPTNTASTPSKRYSFEPLALGRTGRSKEEPWSPENTPVGASEPISVESERKLGLLEEKALEDEIIESLITNLRIPLPSTQTVATKKEIFFPAHLIGTIMMQMIQSDLAFRMQNLLGNAMKAIQSLTMKFEDDYVSAFWLSNCYELLCVVRTAQEKEAREQSRRRMANGRRGSDDASEAERALEKVRSDLDYLLVEIYHGWIKELKKRLNNMIVPAVIENQSLPGYICKQSGGLWGKWGKSASTSQFTIEQLLNFLSKLSKTMRCYYMEDSMTRQILTELLRVIGVSAFNHLLMRKNFCTWKRGVQIQYNVSRLEEWCTSHGIAEATLHLQQLLQAAKLLTLNKTSPQDIETIFDVCFLLNPTQIKKLLSLYYAADFDSPLSPELLKIVASRAMLNEKSDVLLLDLDQGPDFSKPNPRTVDQVEKFVPAWMNLPNISAAVQTA
ncbi:P-loop containing nucleoside triphosphate hydrolase protein [Cladochytrium replicatum]|nr:P-loop containing nucleoside triphosphate hydrolase protein [Cladochytrium replicatum]